ncbi:hypothetical protein LOTGIDRAFT_126211 [Lottia gigantea]|uniref:Uncharacterized protein n=1 Tax=Lottia gigantea TaxID=225164 RepID=V4A4Y3_LOTGI|nr:hypothetical protein LOTGIDRAFT_126211 [Lottia gigantea]ESO88321.1 hypothetical protein LOTGIDRAFT_126211 [Lottia gigantea]
MVSVVYLIGIIFFIISGVISCPRGCASCSPVNGCVTCESQYFMFLYRQNIRQIGICTPSCPVGYYGVRYQYYNKCNRCHIQHCQACFSRHYCTRCETPYLAFQGQCIEKCPNNTHYANYSKECRDRVDCMVGPWSSWSHCARNGVTCGYKYGFQTKTRLVLEYPSINGARCPSLVDTRSCLMARRHCSGRRHFSHLTFSCICYKFLLARFGLFCPNIRI